MRRRLRHVSGVSPVQFRCITGTIYNAGQEQTTEDCLREVTQRTTAGAICAPMVVAPEFGDG